MHYSKLLIVAVAAFIQGSLAVRVKTYTGRDCTGAVQDLSIDNHAACDSNNNRFQSYQENGWGKNNGQRIAFYSAGSCTTETFLYDTYSYNGDFFKSKTCYNIDGHSPAKFAQGMALY